MFSASKPLLRVVLTIIILMLVAPSFAQTHQHVRVERPKGSVIVEFPPNKLGERQFVAGPDDELERRTFNFLIDEITKPYLELINQRRLFMNNPLARDQLYLVRFVVDERSRDWTNPTVNAGAEQTPLEGTGLAIWTIKMYGGLYRRPELTKDGFALIVCHEIGHHLGGFPFHVDSFTGVPLGVASEGQADYFATQYCLREFWRHHQNTPPYEGPKGTQFRLADLPKELIQSCRRVWSTQADRLLCFRIAIAGFSVAALWGEMDRDNKLCETPSFPRRCAPDLTSFDNSVVTGTELVHGRAQCRFDTYFNGALCPTDFNLGLENKLIPGKFEHLPENSGRARIAAFARSCSKPLGPRTGTRPLCWFHPRWPDGSRPAKR